MNLTNPYGFCPKCGKQLVYNRANQQIQCNDPTCFFSREYTQEDWKNTEDELAHEYLSRLKFEELYGQGNSEGDKAKLKNIFKF